MSDSLRPDIPYEYRRAPGSLDWRKEHEAARRTYVRARAEWISDVMKARLSAGIFNKGDIEIVEAIYNRVHHDALERVERLDKLAHEQEVAGSE